MSAETIFTRRPAGLDYRVWLTAIIAALVSVGILGFKMANSVTCYTVMIIVKPPSGQPEGTYYTGEQLAFTAEMAKSKTVRWDFGDGPPAISGPSVVHVFKTDGSFLVSATVNGKCAESVTLLIRRPVSTTVAVTPVADSTPIFGPDAPVAGEPVRYTAAGAAQSYEWTVLNSPDFPMQTEPSATYIFPAPGTRVIEVKLDNDPAKTFRKTITILPAAKSVPAPVAGGNVPPPEVAPPVWEAPVVTPEAPKTMVIPDEEFKNMLEAVKDGSKDVSSFAAVLCSGAQTKVLANEGDWQTLGELCGKIHDNRKYVIKSVQSVRNEKNCVTLLKVRYKKKGLLGL